MGYLPEHDDETSGAVGRSGLEMRRSRLRAENEAVYAGARRRLDRSHIRLI